MSNPRMTLDLSDGLTELSQLLADYEHEPRVLDPEDARTLRQCLRVLRSRARDLENELSRHRWNTAARAEHEQRRREAEAVMDAISAPNSNVALFPVIARPFADGRADPREWR